MTEQRREEFAEADRRWRSECGKFGCAQPPAARGFVNNLGLSVYSCLDHVHELEIVTEWLTDRPKVQEQVGVGSCLSQN